MACKREAGGRELNRDERWKMLSRWSVTHSDVFLFAEEAHPDVVPERWALGDGVCGDAVLVHGHVIISMSLHHTAGGKDGLNNRKLYLLLCKL